MESISRHITPLVINSLGGGHTHTHTDNPHRINFKKPGARRPQASARLVKNDEISYKNLEMEALRSEMSKQVDLIYVRST